MQPVPSDRSAAVLRSGLLNVVRSGTSAFIPAAAREGYMALRAFNASLAAVADIVSNPTAGAMRMQFWRDEIHQAFQGSSPPHEPVTALLSHALHGLEQRGGRMNKAWLLRLITAREQRLHNPPYPDLAALESYAESTYSTLLYLTLSLFPIHSVTADHLASHIGKATGIAAVLRGLPILAFPSAARRKGPDPALKKADDQGASGQGTVLLPLDVMANADLQEEDVFRYRADAPGLKDAVFAVATRANDHLITAREMLKNLRAGQDIGHEFVHQDDEGHDYSSSSSSSSSPPPVASDSDSQTRPRAKQDPMADVQRGFGALMPAVATGLWLERLEQYGCNVFKPQLLQKDWKLPWRAYSAFRKRKL
ncbi:MAG: hypothetical protein M1826_005585 [Phylliscum demangeonii]|nr:MAG: hypothetical protein M1826_005585 [Phylliscum demangeonii]